MKTRPFKLAGGALAVLLAFGLSAVGAPHDKTDRSGRKQVGKASYYANKFAGRKMADGTPMQLDSNNAAHRTLPFGTTARVTNLDTGESAMVVIRDRGPHVPGRIIDLSPSTAMQIGITPRHGVGRVEVEPMAAPLLVR
jgi:rare lipoprotein A